DVALAPRPRLVEVEPFAARPALLVTLVAAPAAATAVPLRRLGLAGGRTPGGPAAIGPRVVALAAAPAAAVARRLDVVEVALLAGVAGAALAPGGPLGAGAIAVAVAVAVPVARPGRRRATLGREADILVRHGRYLPPAAAPLARGTCSGVAAAALGLGARQQRLAAQAHRAEVVDVDHLDLDLVADLHDVGHGADELVRQLRDVHEAFL